MENNKIFKLLVVVILVCFGFYSCKEKNDTQKNIYKELSGDRYQDSIISRIYENSDNPIFNYKDALKSAQNSDKKMIVIFSSIACVDCRKFETRVLFHPEIKRLISKYFVLVFLFGDDMRKLPTNEVRLSEITKREIKTFGQYNTHLQINKVQSGSLPEIYMFNQKGEVLNPYKDIFTPGRFKPEKFIDWLKSNLDPAGS